MALDPALSEARVSLGYVTLFERWDWKGAEEELQRAVAFSPASAEAHQWHALLPGHERPLRDALEEVARAQELDPLSLTVNTNAGLLLYLRQQYEPEVEQHRRALELDPDYGPAHWALGLAYAQQGQHEEAIAAHRRAVELWEGSALFRAVLGRSYALAGRRAEAEAVLRELEAAASDPVSPYHLAILYALLGDHEDRAAAAGGGGAAARPLARLGEGGPDPRSVARGPTLPGDRAGGRTLGRRGPRARSASGLPEPPAQAGGDAPRPVRVARPRRTAASQRNAPAPPADAGAHLPVRVRARRPVARQPRHLGHHLERRPGTRARAPARSARKSCCSCGRSGSSWMARPALPCTDRLPPHFESSSWADDAQRVGAQPVAVARLRQRDAEARAQRPGRRRALREAAPWPAA